MSEIAIYWLLLAVGCSHALPTRIERMTMSKMRMADLETSATGYSYNQQHGLPVSYIQYTNHGSGHYYDAPQPLEYIATLPVAYGQPAKTYQTPSVLPYVTPSPVISNYGSYLKGETQIDAPVVPEYVVPIVPKKKQPLAPYYVPGGTVTKVDFDDDVDDENEDDDDDDVEEDHDDDDFDVNDTGDYGDGIEPRDEHYDEKGGSNYKASHHAVHGDESKKGYEKYDTFDKGEKGEHERDNHKGYYNEEGGHKKSHSDTAARYNEHDESEKGVKGESHGEASYHKRGQKTKGFHNIYHKDEYKKDTDFYDENHNSGHYDKHGDEEEYHEAAEGGFVDNGHHDSRYENRDAGEKGHFDKGRNHAHHTGYAGAKGENSYHQKHADYGAKGAFKGTKAHGYSSGDY